MEQNLSLSLGQKLAMTAKLQQAIRILQLSAQDLRATIENEYLENPALEMEDGGGEKLTEQYSFDDIGALAKYLDGGGASGTGGVVRDEEGHPGVEGMAVLPQTLGAILEEQVNLTFADLKQHKIAAYMIGSIDDRGYLMGSAADFSKELHCTEGEIEAVLQIIQTFEPEGVGARDLRECLTIQAKHLGIYEGLIAAILEKYLDDVANSHYKGIAEKEKCTPGDVQAAVDIIRRLNPKPGSVYGGSQPDYIVPDVIVRKIGGEYVVLVNDYGVPRLNISAAYKNSAGFDKETKKYIETKINSAAWLIKSIEQRRNTLFNVVTEIVRQQRAFFDKGPDFLRPMLMKDVADNAGVHESTVSRSTANKYVETPHGVMPLKSFFTANLNLNGEELIAAQVKTMIKKMIESENPQKPWSDQQLSEMLKEKGMRISRRTVMKYREQMGYLSSVKRKRY